MKGITAIERLFDVAVISMDSAGAEVASPGDGFRFNSGFADKRLALPNEVSQCYHQHSNDRIIQLAPCAMRNRLRAIHVFLTLDALRREFERPGENQCRN